MKTAIRILCSLNVIAFLLISLWLREDIYRRVQSRCALGPCPEEGGNSFSSSSSSAADRNFGGRIQDGTRSTNTTLVMFTTFKPGSLHHALAHRLVVSNWAALGGGVRPVLFANRTADDPNGVGRFLIGSALSSGWEVLPLVSTNAYGTPHLRPMFEEVFRRYEASYYAYANGDLLFTDDLLLSLEFLSSQRAASEISGNVLLVGQRTDVDLDSDGYWLFPSTVPIPSLAPSPSSLSSPFPRPSSSSSYSSSSSSSRRKKPLLNDTAFRRLESLFGVSNLPVAARERGRLREGYAIDYFVFSGGSGSGKSRSGTFSWKSLAEVVVGRAGVDNYLIAMANRFNVNTVDASEAVLAVHLSRPGFRDTGALNNDTGYNVELVGRTFPYEFGHTTNARFRLEEADGSPQTLKSPKSLRLTRRTFE